MPEFSIIQGDAVDTLRKLSAGSIDLIVTSPPYNIGGWRRSKGKGLWRKAQLADGYASYPDKMPHDQYVHWQRNVLMECWRVLSDDGAIFYNHKPRHQGGELLFPLDLNPGLPIRDQITWVRNGGHNFSRSHFLPTSEWIIVFAKPHWRLANARGCWFSNVWTIPAERGNDHPAPFPVELARRAITATEPKLVCDPFAGSGSAGVAAMQEGRNFVGIEIDSGYAAKARARIEAVRSSSRSVACSPEPQGCHRCRANPDQLPRPWRDVPATNAVAQKNAAWIHDAGLILMAGQHCGFELFEAWQFACYLALTTDLIRWDSRRRPIPLSIQVLALRWFTSNVARLRDVSVTALRSVARVMAESWSKSTQDRLLEGLLLEGASTCPGGIGQHDWKYLILAMTNRSPRRRGAAIENRGSNSPPE